jgi:hypothetical protein
MERRHFLQMTGMIAAMPAIAVRAGESAAKQTERNIYEWSIYALNSDGKDLDDFFRNILLPAYGKLGVRTGAFKPYGAEAEKQRYFLFIHRNWNEYVKSGQLLWQDETFVKASAPFYRDTATNPAYSEYQTFLCEAFSRFPVLLTPSGERTLFEFRNYKSPNEEANLRKIKMFETEEVALFDKIGIHSVCYGNVVAGPRRPSLIYLTWHKDEDARNEAWKQFGASSQWKEMRSRPEYANTATDNKIVLLSPMAYSQI